MIGIGSTLRQRFLLEKELGRGGMGAVYAANDLVLQRGVAIKVLKEQGGEEVGKRLRLEAQIAARLLHENVVRIYDFGDDGGTSYLVMEKVDGTSFSRRWRLISLHERLQILAQVADALDYAHHQGVIHRDVKPGNVLLTQADVSKLSDFGLSMIIESSDESGVIRGTPHYMSPEQAKAKRLDHRTDLYSLGVMLYEASTGTMPFSGSTLSIITQHSTARPEPPRLRNAEVSEPLERLILQLMAKDPDVRPGNGALVAEALREEAARLRGQENTAQISADLTGQPVQPTSTSKIALPLDASTLAELAQGSSVRQAGADAGPAKPPSRHSLAPSVVVASARDRAGGIPEVSPSAVSGSGSRPSPVRTPDSLVAQVSSELVRKMLATVLEEPVILSADERYLFGHYLAYLLIGSRRGGFLNRRKLERRNGDRARLILALTYALTAESSEAAVAEAAELLDRRIEIRPSLCPAILAKYLRWRTNGARRKQLRQTRKAVLEQSAYARKKMTDARGVLNPGLIPRSLEDLRKIAPPRDEIDDELVGRWNRLAEVWRDRSDFRSAALRYASNTAYRDPSGGAMWAEVVYPLIELARWQRQSRSRGESLLDFLLGRVLRVPDPGIQLDRILSQNVPSYVVQQLDDSARLFEEMLARNEPEDHLDIGEETEHLGLPPGGRLDAEDMRLGQIPEEDEADGSRELVRLSDPDPLRFLQGQLQELWVEALSAMQGSRPPGPGKAPGHRSIPVGPYRLVVIASIRGSSAGQVAIQGMGNKQIEILTPSLRTGGMASRPILAVWLYQDNSLVIAHHDFRSAEVYIIWDAPRGHQHTFHDPADVYRELAQLHMEAPGQLESALSRRFRPSRKA